MTKTVEKGKNGVQSVQKAAKLLNILVDSYEKFSKNELPEVVLKEFVGHTPLQVTTGILLGIMCAFAMHFIVFA